MTIIDSPVPLNELQELAASRFGNMVKAVVDVQRQLMAVDAEMHSDEEGQLLAGGSRQEDLWGINLYPELPVDDWIEFDSMINIRPYHSNRTRGVDDPATRERISSIVNSLVVR